MSLRLTPHVGAVGCAHFCDRFICSLVGGGSSPYPKIIGLCRPLLSRRPVFVGFVQFLHSRPCHARLRCFHCDLSQVVQHSVDSCSRQTVRRTYSICNVHLCVFLACFALVALSPILYRVPRSPPFRIASGLVYPRFAPRTYSRLASRFAMSTTISYG